MSSPNDSPSQANEATSKLVLGNQVHIDFEKFPELKWLEDYLAALSALQIEQGQISKRIQAIAREGEVYCDQWIEPYTKTKGDKTYTYYQLRWLTGERKLSGQPKIKTKHLSQRQLKEARAAIARGKQVEALNQQRRAVEDEMSSLKQLVLGMSSRLKRHISQKI